MLGLQHVNLKCSSSHNSLYGFIHMVISGFSALKKKKSPIMQVLFKPRYVTYA